MPDASLKTFATPGHFGAASRGVAIAPATIAAAWNVQGQAGNPAFVDAVRRLFAVDLARAPNTTARSDALTALWLAPRSWLLAAGGDSPLADYPAKRDAVHDAGGALFDVSASRVAWTLSGPRASDVLAAGCPLDLHSGVFRAGDCAQSLFGHVNTLVEKRDDAPTFVLMVGRSFARDVERALAVAAAQHGCDVLPAVMYR